MVFPMLFPSSQEKALDSNFLGEAIALKKQTAGVQTFKVS